MTINKFIKKWFGLTSDNGLISKDIYRLIVKEMRKIINTNGCTHCDHKKMPVEWCYRNCDKRYKND